MILSRTKGMLCSFGLTTTSTLIMISYDSYDYYYYSAHKFKMDRLQKQNPDHGKHARSEYANLQQIRMTRRSASYTFDAISILSLSLYSPLGPQQSSDPFRSSSFVTPQYS